MTLEYKWFLVRCIGSGPWKFLFRSAEEGGGGVFLRSLTSGADLSMPILHFGKEWLRGFPWWLISHSSFFITTISLHPSIVSWKIASLSEERSLQLFPNPTLETVFLLQNYTLSSSFLKKRQCSGGESSGKAEEKTRFRELDYNCKNKRKNLNPLSSFLKINAEF